MVETNENSIILSRLGKNPTLEEVQEMIAQVSEEHELEVAKRKLGAEVRRMVVLSARTGTAIKYCPEYPAELIEHLRTGRSFITFAAKIGVAPSSLHNWKKKYPDFTAAFEIGTALQMSTWEELLIGVAEGRTKGDFKAISFALKNYFPKEYTDKKEVEHKATQIIIETGVIKPEVRVIEPVVVDNKVIENVSISRSMSKVIEQESEEREVEKSTLADLI